MDYRIVRRILKGALLLFIIAELSGCGFLFRRADGAPHYNVDVSKIPDAVPKYEPLSRYGNPSSYVVNGHRYYVMRSAKGYHQRGMASWYGTKFHGHLTSTREHYDLTSMTAASPILPLPTYVQATNLANGRRVIVKVNDRGPFAAGRIMDLSYAAAKKLGYLGKGTAYIDVVALDPRHWQRQVAPPEYYAQNKTNYPRPPVIAGNPNQRPYKNSAKVITGEPHEPTSKRAENNSYLQAGAFGNLASAKQLATKITNNCQLPTRVTSDQASSHPVYRVQVGPFANQSEEGNGRAVLTKNGLGSLVAVRN